MSEVKVELPDLRTVARHAAPRIVEGTVVPLVIFAVGLRLVGVWGSMIVGLAWVYGAVLTRLVRRRPVPGVLLIGAASLTARTLIALWSHSVVVYFLQPSLGTMLVAGAFLASVPLDRPLAGRLARDFCPLPEDLHLDERIHRFFRQISVLWAVTQITNALLTIWLLTTQSVGTFVVTRTAVSALCTVVALAGSLWWFRSSMRRQGIPVTLPVRRPIG
mgnify:FL=1